MELCHERDPRQPDQPSAKAIVSACVADGLLVIAAGAHGNAIRFLPALTISDAELDAGLDIIERHTLANA
jgi:4-aminobutyrate aminotransferase-like enzyme